MCADQCSVLMMVQKWQKSNQVTQVGEDKSKMAEPRGIVNKKNPATVWINQCFGQQSEFLTSGTHIVRQHSVHEHHTFKICAI